MSAGEWAHRPRNLTRGIFDLAFIMLTAFGFAGIALAEPAAILTAVTDFRFTSIGPLAAKGGAFGGVAKIAASEPGGAGWGIIAIDGNGRIELVSRLPHPAGNVESSVEVARAAILANGDLVLVGSVGSAKASATTSAGWAARIDTTGGIIWSRIYDQEGETSVNGAFAFALPVDAQQLLLGGTQARGSACMDEAYGVLLAVSLEDGAPLGDTIRLAGNGRRGLVDGHRLLSGDLFLTGYTVTGKRADGCQTQAWFGTADASGRWIAQRHWQAATSVMPIRTVADGNLGLAVYSRLGAGNVANGPATGLIRLDFDRSLRVADVETSDDPFLPGAEAVLPLGTAHIRASRQARTDPAQIDARLTGADGSCLAEVRVVGPAAGQLRLISAIGASAGSALLAGTLEAPRRRGVWTAPIRSQPPSKDAISLAPGGATTSSLLQTEKGRTVLTIAVTAPANVTISARQIEGDVDLHLSDADGTLLAISDHTGSAAEWLGLPLKQGRYELAVVTNGETALTQVAIAGIAPSSAAIGDGKEARGELSNPEAVVAALELLGYGRVDVNEVLALRSNALAAFAVSQCQLATADPEQPLFVAAARSNLRKARLLEAEARDLTLREGKMPFALRRGESEMEQSFAQLLGESDKHAAPTVVAKIANSETIVARSAPSRRKEGEPLFLTDLAGPIVWTNADDDRLLIGLATSPKHAFGSIEQADGTRFIGLLGTIDLAQKDLKEAVRIASENGRIVRPDGQVKVMASSPGSRGEGAIEWKSALWDDFGERQADARRGTLAWPIGVARTVATAFQKGSGDERDGIAFAVDGKTTVAAAHDGTVIYAGDGFRQLGQLVVIQGEGDLVTAYGHLSRVQVRTGQLVRKAEAIGIIGEGGGEPRNLHFEVRIGARAIDPEPLLASATSPARPPRSRRDDAKEPDASKHVINREKQDLANNVGDVVYFSTDDTSLSPEAQATLKKQAAWLRQYARYTVTIEGHDDERSSREDAIEIGAKRAQAARNFLIKEGIAASRLRTISYGKERPVAICNDISCWSQNRRARTVLNDQVDGKAPPVSGEELDEKPTKSKENPAADNTPSTEQVAKGSGKFRWPVKGRIAAPFGRGSDGGNNDGINILVPKGTDVLAAESGIVAYAGSELKGYGNLILIRHEGGWVTAYAHNDSLLAKRGDTIKRGAVIAKAGDTGGVDQPQVHFEVRQNSKPVDPLPLLGN